jgi:fibronectin type 3 domain-containing protein/DNA-binding beta-propeller fold protein YncE
MPKVVKWPMMFIKAAMKTAIANSVVLLAVFFGVTHLSAQTTGVNVEPLSGGQSSATGFSSYSGFVNGLTGTSQGIAQFNTPCGIIVDTTGHYIFVADRNNNAVRKLAVGSDGLFDDGNTYTFASASAPIGVAVDVADNVYVLNYGNGLNGSVYEYNLSGNAIATNAINLAHAGGIALDSGNNIYVTVNSNQLIRIAGTNITTIATIPIAGTMLQGVVVKKIGATAGLIAVSDSGRNGIYLINPTSGLVITNAGFNGAGDFPLGSDSANSGTALFNQPMSMAEVGDGSLLVADYGNNRVKVVVVGNGSVTNFYGVNSYYWGFGPGTPPDYPGWGNGNVFVPDYYGDVEARLPFGVAVGPNGVIYTTEDYYHIIREVTGGGFPLPPPSVSAAPTGLTATLTNSQILLSWIASYGATSYNIQRSTNSGGPYTFIANTTGTNYTDAAVFNGTTYYYVISSVSPSGTSANSAQVSATVPPLAPPTNLAAVTATNQVVLTWTGSSGATSYNVERATTNGGPYAILASTSATNYTDTTIVSGTTYYYVVQAAGPGGTTSVNSSQVSSAPPTPPAPTNLVATVTNSQVVLTWAASFGATSYNVQRSTTNGGPYTILANTSATNYTDTAVFNGATYYYVIAAVNASGTSTNSSQVSSGVIPPFFSTPSGIAVDTSGGNLAIADHANNAIRILNVASSQTSTFLYASNGISAPSAVLYDTSDNLYVLNQNAGPNGNIIEFDPYGNTIATNAAGLNQATAFTMDQNGNIFVTEQSSNIFVVFPSGATNTLVSITNANVSLQGIALFDDGSIAVSDAGNHVIWTVNPITKVVTLLSGKVGVSGSTLGASNFAKLFQPHQLARAGGNVLVVADTGNNRLVTVTRGGAITNVLNSTNASIWFGQTGDPVNSSSSRFVPMVSPVGVAVSAVGSYSGTVFASETTYNDIRGMSGALGAPNPAPIVTLPYFNNPSGIAFDPGGIAGPSLFIADAANNAIEELNLANNYTSTFLSSSDGITNPASVLLDPNENVYVLNQNSGGNGSILVFDIFGNAYGPLVTGLNNPTAFTMDGNGTIFVAQQSGGICIVYPSGATNTLTSITNAGVSLQGIALFDNGNIAVSDAGNHVIWVVNPITKTYSRLTGQLGASGSTLGSSSFAKLNQPHQLARANGNLLAIADYGNNRLVYVNSSGYVTNVLNSTNALVWFGQNGDPVANTSSKFVSMRSPSGVAVGSGGEVFASETYYEDVRGLLATVLTYPAFGSSVPLSYYSAPAGIALNFEGTVLYVADPTNNTVSALNLANNQTTLFLNSGNGLTNPVDVAVDNSDNLYVLNQGGGGNGSVLKFDKYGNFLGANVTGLLQPTAMLLGSLGNIYVTETNSVQVFNTGVSNTLATITNANARLQGIAVLQNGSIVVSDAGDDVIWSITPPSTNAVLFTGAVGVATNTFGSAAFARLNTPMRLAETGSGQLLIVDSGNKRIVVCDGSGTISTALNSSNGVTLWFGLGLDPVSTSSPYYQSMSSPMGMAIGGNGTVYDSEVTYKDVRGIPNTGYTPQITPPASPLNLSASTTYGQVTLSWSASAGAATYNIARSPSVGGPYTVIATNISATTYSDTTVLSGTTYYYVVSAVNSGGASANSTQVSATAPVPPPPAPLIGWYDYEGNAQTGFYTVLHPVGSLANPYIAYNDLLLAINPVTNGVATYYITGAAPLSGVPGVTNGSTPPFYADGQSYVTPLTVTTVPNLEIEAVNVGPGGSSAVTTAAFVFQVGGPTITGNNGANFTISDVTSNAYYYYTTDGSVPANGISVSTNYLFLTTNGVSISTNAFSSASAGYSISGANYQLIVTNNFSVTTNYFPVATTGLAVAAVTNGLTSIGPVTNSPATLSLNVSTSNVTFTVRAFRNGYLPSSPATQVFTPGAFVPNTISFGFASGEASSDFVASPGQTFVAPVTLSPLPTTTIYSMQFNLTVTNLGSAPPLAPGAYGFQSMLEKPYPLDATIYISIPPLMYYPYAQNPPPANQVTTYITTANGSQPFVNLETTNSSLNLLGVGWLERAGQKNLYNTLAQTLITYSQAHDVQFLSANGKVEVGGYSFQVPAAAAPGDSYQIKIGQPSATDDGIGAPGSLVYIYAPTNGSLAGGSLNSIKNVTVGQRKYLVGDAYPFRWFNAGDFGNTNLENADVEQVFEAAIYGLDAPPAGSDFFDTMDSCGGTYVDLGHGYLEFNSFISGAGALNPLFDGNDTSINQIAFGDGTLDVCDIYVTFRRSLDPSLTLFQRFWTNGVRVAQVFASSNLVSLSSLSKTSASSPAPVSITNTPAVNFASTDYVATAGQVLQIPVTAKVFGSYPLRVAMLNISVVPLDGSPSLTVPVSFTPGALGTPYITSSQGVGNYAAAWLSSTIAGISNSAVVGTLTVTIPTNATSLSSYAIHFDHASGSPNGLASLPKQTLTGLITLSSRTNSTYGDGIPDSWRLRWFGTVNNLLSVSNANPTGDGINNWQKYTAGVDPNTAKDFPKLNPETAPPAGYSSAIYWPTVSGKKYAIQRSASLFPGSWTTIVTNTGTGTQMEYDDNAAGKAKFYRVLILP